MNARARAGLAMPMVLLLILVAGALITVTLQRQDALTRSTARRLTAYQELHAQRGLQEIVEMWLNFEAQMKPANAIDEDGFAFELELADRSRVRVYVEEAQGAARRELDGLGRTARNRAEGVLQRLAETLGGEDRLLGRDREGRPITRDVGPVAVSAATAPRTVLVAAALYALRDTRRAETYAEAIIAARLDGTPDAEDLEDAAQVADADITERALLERVVTSEPRLWWCEAELIGTDIGRPNAIAARYGGYLLATDPARGNEPVDEANRETAPARGRGSFLTWTRLDPDAPRGLAHAEMF